MNIAAGAAGAALAAEQPQTAVLVPAILGVGLLFTLGHNLVQGMRARNRSRRRAEIEGHTSAALVVGGWDSALAERTGMRSRWTYLILGTACMALAIYLAIGAWANFFGATWWSENIAWIAVLIQAASLAFGAAGVYLLTLGLYYRQPPAWARPFIARNLLGRHARISAPRGWRRPARADKLRLLGTQHITDRIAFTARLVAVLWSLVAMSVFTFLALRGQIPRADSGGTIEGDLAVPLQVGLLVVIAVGLILAWRWEAVGAAVMAVAGAALAVLAGVQYPPTVAVAVSLLFLAPAFLHWVAWQRDRGAVHIAVLFAVTAVLVGGVWAGSGNLYQKYFGPAHPESSVAALPDSAVQWVWAGGTTSTSTEVVARLNDPAERVRVVLTSSSNPDRTYTSDPATADDADHLVVRARFDGLIPDTGYRYAVEVDGGLDEIRTGTLRTLPTGSARFAVAFASCARTGSNGAVFDAIRELQPLLFLSVGDFHYANIDTDDQGLFRAAMDANLTAPAQSALYRSTSVGYVWDDHDYAGNDANETAAARPAAQAVYRQYVPHYEIPADGPIYQAVTVGRVRFLLTDTRSTRTPQSARDDDAKYMLGPQQEDWFLAELGAARQRDGIVVWVNPDPWIDPAAAGADSWAGYTRQRTRLADAVAANGLTDRLVMLSGDAHMVALDDGMNSDYTTKGSGGFPVMHAAALDRPGGTKGGPYSDGAFPGAGQFGLLQVDDGGGRRISVTYSGRTWDDQTLVQRTFRLQANP